ncbi:choline dehydrogenase [Phlyctema vagabunda]|uniref:Choline dehydrogenase n=1 Tax=Phlyctema vagabunda TaxID=108571 RepID=A0ABR4PGH1_9HELO
MIKNGKHPKAVRVEFLRGKSQYKADPRFNVRRPAIKKHAFASRETIIVGGAFNTPQIRKLSGIGPRSELEKHKIPVIHELPGVGTNLQDNYEHGVVGQSAEIFSPFVKGLLGSSGDQLLAQWVEGHGPYKSGAVGAAVLDKSSVARGDRDLFLIGVFGQFTGFYPGWTRPLFSTPSSLTWDILKVHPRNAAGTVKLRSSNPQDTPDINFNFYHEASKDGKNDPEHDLTAMADAVQLAHRMFAGVKGPLSPITEITEMVPL